MLSDDLPGRINEAALRIISAVIGRLLSPVGHDFGHYHLNLVCSQRWNREGDLIGYDFEGGFSACTTLRCREEPTPPLGRSGRVRAEYDWKAARTQRGRGYPGLSPGIAS